MGAIRNRGPENRGLKHDAEYVMGREGIDRLSATLGSAALLAAIIKHHPYIFEKSGIACNGEAPSVPDQPEETICP